mmetsp:Transcript_1045/g.2202  ORF Transcript_1045/g.2202 Transcript_1045/m.2202 type:complete len:429 (-) Transcript_1045:52-1338(-)
MLLAFKKRGTDTHGEYRDFANITENDPNLLKLDRSNKSTDGNNHGKRLHRCRPPGGVDIPFPRRLHMVLSKAEEEGFGHIISWQRHGRCFLVHEPKLFEQVKCLNIKYNSFQRQLNLYGFRRLSRGADRGCYYHEFFLRGKAFLCQFISRTRIKGTGVKSKLDPDTEPDFYSLDPVESKKNIKRKDLSKPNDELKIEIEAFNFASQYRGQDSDEPDNEDLAMIYEVEKKHHSSRNSKLKFLGPPVFVSLDTSPRSISLSILNQKCSSSNNIVPNERKWFDYPPPILNVSNEELTFSLETTWHEFIAAKELVVGEGAVVTRQVRPNKRASTAENSNVLPLLCFPKNEGMDVEDYFSGISGCESSLSYQDLLKDLDTEEHVNNAAENNIASSSNHLKKMKTDNNADWKELAEASFSSDLLVDTCSCSSLL